MVVAGRGAVVAPSAVGLRPVVSSAERGESVGPGLPGWTVLVVRSDVIDVAGSGVPVAPREHTVLVAQDDEFAPAKRTEPTRWKRTGGAQRRRTYCDGSATPSTAVTWSEDGDRVARGPGQAAAWTDVRVAGSAWLAAFVTARAGRAEVRGCDRCRGPAGTVRQFVWFGPVGGSRVAWGCADTSQCALLRFAPPVRFQRVGDSADAEGVAVTSRWEVPAQQSSSVALTPRW